jgi:hypothetical protein
VRRDKEAARAREEAEEQRMQEADAARRLAILRGEIPPPLDPTEPEAALPPPRGRDRDAYSSQPGTSRKRKRHGEDDTDFEMRLARERSAVGAHAARELAPLPSTTSPSLVDSKGHITLFPPPETTTSRPREQNEDFARDAARKERDFKDTYQMRFVNAAGGKDGQGLTDGGPWYASADGEVSGALVPGKDVWGREDPKRKVREAARLDASDPLGMMKRGARMVRELERERRKELEEREREVRALEREERRRKERRREKRRRREEEGRDRGHAPDSDGGSERCARSHREDTDRGESKRDRGEERERDNRSRMDRSNHGSDRRERTHRRHDERERDKSRDWDRRREHRHESRHRDDERHHRSHTPDYDGDRFRHKTDQR